MNGMWNKTIIDGPVKQSHMRAKLSTNKAEPNGYMWQPYKTCTAFDFECAGWDWQWQRCKHCCNKKGQEASSFHSECGQNHEQNGGQLHALNLQSSYEHDIRTREGERFSVSSFSCYMTLDTSAVQICSGQGELMMPLWNICMMFYIL